MDSLPDEQAEAPPRGKSLAVGLLAAMPKEVVRQRDHRAVNTIPERILLTEVAPALILTPYSEPTTA